MWGMVRSGLLGRRGGGSGVDFWGEGGQWWIFGGGQGLTFGGWSCVDFWGVVRGGVLGSVEEWTFGG